MALDFARTGHIFSDMRKNFWIIVIIISLASIFAFAQKQKDSREERIKKALQMREELHRRLFEHFFNGSLSTEDIFKDMDSLFDDSLSGLGSNFLGGESEHFQMSWSESKEGRSLLIKPKSKDQKFEINVEHGMIKIEGKTEEKTEYGTSISQFSQSFSVPQDCDSTKVKILEKEGNILLSFPFIGGIQKQPVKPQIAPKKEDRFPLKPSQGDVEI